MFPISGKSGRQFDSKLISSLRNLCSLSAHRFECSSCFISTYERKSFQIIAAFGETLNLPLTAIPSGPIQVADLSTKNPWNLRIAASSSNSSNFKFCLIVPLVNESMTVGTMTFLDSRTRSDFDSAKLSEVLETVEQVCDLFQEFTLFQSEQECVSPTDESSQVVIAHVLSNIKTPLRHLGALTTSTLLNPAKQQQEILTRKITLKKELQKGLQAITDYKKFNQFYLAGGSREMHDPANEATYNPKYSFQPSSSGLLDSTKDNGSSSNLFTPVQVVHFLQGKVQSQPQGDTDSRLKWDIFYPTNPTSPGLINKLEISTEQLSLIADYLEILVILGFQQWKKVKVAVHFKDGLSPSFFSGGMASSLSSSFSPRNSLSRDRDNSNTFSSSSGMVGGSGSSYLELEITLSTSQPIPDIRTMFRRHDLVQTLQICDNFLENSMVIIPNHRFERLSPSVSKDSKRISFFYKKISCYQPSEPEVTTNPAALSESDKRKSKSFVPSIISSFFSRPTSSSRSRSGSSSSSQHGSSTADKFPLDRPLNLRITTGASSGTQEDSGRTSNAGGDSQTSEVESFSLASASQELFRSRSQETNGELNDMIHPSRKAKIGTSPAHHRLSGIFHSFSLNKTPKNSQQQQQHSQEGAKKEVLKHNSVVPLKMP